MKKAYNIYYCKTRTEATDRANLLYISTNATQMQHDSTRRAITLMAKNKRIIAVLQY